MDPGADSRGHEDPLSQRVPLTRRIRVVLYYVTAAVMPGDGTIHFAADICNQDPRLDRALAAATRRRPCAAFPDYQRRTRPVSTCTKLESG